MISKVLIVRNAPYPVNINSYNDQYLGLARAFAKRGISSDIIFYSKKKSYINRIEHDPDINIYNIKGFRVLRTGIYPKLLRKEFLNKYDFIITTEYSQIMTPLLGKISNKPVILYTGPYYNLFKIPFCSYLYDIVFTRTINNNVKGILTKSSLATKFMEDKGYTNVETIGVGQDIQRFKEHEQKDSKLDSVISFMKSGKTILIVGSIDSRKNFPYTIQIFKKVLEYDKGFRLLVVGEGKKKFIDDSLKCLTNKEKNKIKFAGRLKNQQLKYIYPEAHVFLLPSKLEIFGMVLLEAMYFGVPVISSINGGSETLINNNKNGFVVDINQSNISEWVNIIKLLDSNNEIRKNISNAAKDTIVKHYSWDIISNYFLNLFN